MKFFKLVLTLSLFFGLSVTPALANEKPSVESFVVNPASLEITSISTLITFELVVSHPLGIENEKVEITMKNSRNDTFRFTINRTDKPTNFQLKKVTFKGAFEFPRNASPGVYNFESSSIQNNDSTGYQYETGVISGPKLRNTLGAETGVIVTYLNYLDLVYDTFVGPTYDTTAGVSFNDVRRYNSGVTPIWRVGQVYTPAKFFELRVPSMKILIESSTPKTCSSDGEKLTFLSEGICAFTVSTERNTTYAAKKTNQTSTILSKKKQIELFVEKIDDLDITGIPKSITLPTVIGGPNIYVMPKSSTPSICIVTDLRLTILSGGDCILVYQTPETDDYEASEEYIQKIKVKRKLQAIDFTLPKSAPLQDKSISLIAKSSSGLKLFFRTSNTVICSVDGETLKLLSAGNCEVTAFQEGTAVFEPASAVQVINIMPLVKDSSPAVCIKGNKKITLKKEKAKCPSGYRKLKFG